MNSDDGQDKLSNTDAGGNTNAKQRSLTMRNNRLESLELFGEAREIVIAHGNETYRLRLTAQNKLILTK